MGTIARKESCRPERGFHRHRSDRPVGSASPRCARASPYQGGPGPSRRSASRPKHRDRRRTRWPSHARHRKTWPFDVHDAYRFPRPYLEVWKGLRGPVVQTTRVGVESNTERHRRRSPRSRQRTGARDNKHPIFRGQIEVPQRNNNIYLECVSIYDFANPSLPLLSLIFLVL
jgi:hypothetical protein